MDPVNLKYHKIIAFYFTVKPLCYDEKDKESPNIRKLVEQPWQQTNGDLEAELLQTLLDISFLEQKARHIDQAIKTREDNNIVFGGVYSLIEDSIYALERMRLQLLSITSLKDLLQFLRSESHNISRIPSLLRQQALNRPADSILAQAAVKQNSENKLPWFELLNKNVFDTSVVLTIIVSDLNLVAFHVISDGSMILGADKNGCIYIWSGVSGSLKRSFYTEATNIQHLYLTGDKRSIIVTGDNDALLYSLSDNKTIYRFNRSDLKITASTFSCTTNGLKLGIGYANGTIAVWNVEECLLVSEILLSDSPIRNLTLAPDEHLLFANTDDRIIYRFDYLDSNISRLSEFAGTEFFYIPASDIDKDIGARIMQTSGFPQVEVILRNKTTSLAYYAVLKPSKPVALIYIKETSMLVEASNEGEGIINNKIQVLTFWDIQSGNKVKSINCSFGQISALSTLPDGRIAIGTTDGTVEIRDLTENRVFRYKASANPITGLSHTSDGFLTIQSVDKVQLMKLLKGSSDRWNKSEQIVAGLARDGRLLMNEKDTGYSSGASQYLIPTEPCEQFILGQSESREWPVTSICISGDEKVAFIQKYFYGWSKSHYSAGLFNLSSGQLIQFSLWPKNSGTVYQRIPLKNSCFIASLPDGELCIYDMDDGAVKNRFRTSLAKISKIVIDPGGFRLAISDEIGDVVIWDTLTNRKCADTINSPAFKDNAIESISLDGARILAKTKYFSSSDINVNKLVLFKIDLQQTREFYELKSLPAAVCLSPDGALVASGDQEKKILIWDANTAEIKAAISNINSYCFCFSADGNYLAAGSIDSLVVIWRIEPLELICQFPTLSPVSSLQSRGSYLVAGDTLGETYILKFRNFQMEPGLCLMINRSNIICQSCGGRIEMLKDMIGSCEGCKRKFRYISDRLEKPKFTLRDFFKRNKSNVADEIKAKVMWLEKLQDKFNEGNWNKTMLLWAFQDLHELYSKMNRSSQILKGITPLVNGLLIELESKRKNTNASLKEYQNAYKEFLTLIGSEHILSRISALLIKSVQGQLNW